MVRVWVMFGMIQENSTDLFTAAIAGTKKTKFNDLTTGIGFSLRLRMVYIVIRLHPRRIARTAFWAASEALGISHFAMSRSSTRFDMPRTSSHGTSWQAATCATAAPSMFSHKAVIARPPVRAARCAVPVQHESVTKGPE